MFSPLLSRTLPGFRSKRLDATRTATLSRTLSDLLDAGLTVQHALDQMSTQTRDRMLKPILDSGSAGVRSGLPLHLALNGVSPEIPESFLGAVESGESAGNLVQILSGLATMYEQESTLHKALQSALVYPLIVTSVAIGTLTVLFTFLLPRLSVLYEDLSQELPSSTRLLLSVADIARNQGVWILLSLTVVAVVIFGARHRSHKLRLMLAHWRLAMPVVGPILSLRENILFCQSLSGLVVGGVPLSSALDVAARSASNPVFRADIADARKRLAEGVSLSETLRGSRVDQGNLIPLIQVGEEQGELGEAMAKAAKMFQVEIDNRTKMLTTLLEPVLIVGLGFVVAFIVFAMMVPILEIEI